MDIDMEPYKQGAEARLYKTTFLGKPCIRKQRFVKKYRHPQLDQSITNQRFKNEVRYLVRCRTLGVHAPAVYRVDVADHSIYMEDLMDCEPVKDRVQLFQSQATEVSRAALDYLGGEMGRVVAMLHNNSIIHGDLTTSNFMVKKQGLDEDSPRLSVIDFGLSTRSNAAEDKAVDLYVLERALLSTHPNSEPIMATILGSYTKHVKGNFKEIKSKFEEVRMRGRKRTMVG